MTVVDHVKLFRNLPELRFDGRMHEQILGAIRRLGGDVAWTDLYVVHSGSDQSPAAQARKLERDLRLLMLELAERPEHPFTLFNLGMTYRPREPVRRGSRLPAAQHQPVVSGRVAPAEGLWTARLRRDAAGPPRGGARGMPEGTLNVSAGRRAAVSGRRLLLEMGRLVEARNAYLNVLTTQDERHFSSVTRGLDGFMAHQNLAVVAIQMGDLPEAERQWSEVVCEIPRYREGWRGLGDVLIRMQRFDEADGLAAELLKDSHVRVEGLLLTSCLAQVRGRLDEARAALELAGAENPGDWEAAESRCQFLFNHGTNDEAERAFRSMIESDPADADAHHNLGIVLMRSGRHDEAVVAYRQSLRYRPNYGPTFMNLGYALKDSGRLAEAAAAWEQAARLAPNDPAPRQELSRLGMSSGLPRSIEQFVGVAAR